MNKKSAFILTAALLTSPAFAIEDCTQYMTTDEPVLFKLKETGPNPVLIGWQQVSLDMIEKTVCYNLGGNPHIGITITPALVCVNVENDKAPQQKVTINFADKTTLDVSDLFDLKTARQDYVTLQQACVKEWLPQPKEDPKKTKFPLKRPDISYRMPPQQQRQDLGL